MENGSAQTGCTCWNTDRKLQIKLIVIVIMTMIIETTTTTMTVMMMMMLMIMIIVITTTTTTTAAAAAAATTTTTTTTTIIIIIIMIVTTTAIATTTTITTIAQKGAIRDFFFQSPYCAVNCPQHVSSSGPGAIVCKSRAMHRVLMTCNMSCATWYERTAQLLSLTELKSHLFSLYFPG